MKSKIFPIFPILVLLVAGAAIAVDWIDTVAIHSGRIQGETADDGIRVFRGIPFAAPPIGDLRWRPPQDVASWPGVRDATGFGAACPQAPVLARMDTRPATFDEDCLYLNIWTPAANPDEALPVMVWIHGGGLSVGYSHQGMYDGTAFAKQGVVIMSVNYRLGPLGFLAHPALSKESKTGVSGNYGFLDQVASLEWVHRNVAAFGGDPRRVTIFGESAGATSVFALLASPTTKGLFQGAIAESPWVNETNVAYQSRKTPFADSGEAQGVVFATKLLGENASLADLRAFDADEMITTDGFAPFINVDGQFMPELSEKIFAAGKQHNVPMIVGTNTNEGTMFMGGFVTCLDAFTGPITKLYGDQAEKVLALYPAASKEDLPTVADRYITDAWFVRASRAMLNGHGEVSSPAFQYHFTKKSRSIPAWGAHHANELGYVFNTYQGFGPPAEPDASELALGGAMIEYWSQFAKTGDPNTEGRPEWPTFEPGSEKFLELGDEIRVGAELQKESCDTLEAVIAKLGG